MSTCRWCGSLLSRSQRACFNYSFIHFTRVLNVSLFAVQQMVMLWTITHQSEQKWVKEREREQRRETERENILLCCFVFSTVFHPPVQSHLSLIVSILKSYALTHLYSFHHHCSDVSRLCLIAFAFLHVCFFSPSGSLIFFGLLCFVFIFIHFWSHL